MVRAARRTPIQDVQPGNLIRFTDEDDGEQIGIVGSGGEVCGPEDDYVLANVTDIRAMVWVDPDDEEVQQLIADLTGITSSSVKEILDKIAALQSGKNLLDKLKPSGSEERTDYGARLVDANGNRFIRNSDCPAGERVWTPYEGGRAVRFTDSKVAKPVSYEN